MASLSTSFQRVILIFNVCPLETAPLTVVTSPQNAYGRSDVLIEAFGAGGAICKGCDHLPENGMSFAFWRNHEYLHSAKNMKSPDCSWATIERRNEEKVLAV